MSLPISRHPVPVHEDVCVWTLNILRSTPLATGTPKELAGPRFPPSDGRCAVLKYSPIHARHRHLSVLEMLSRRGTNHCPCRLSIFLREQVATNKEDRNTGPSHRIMASGCVIKPSVLGGGDGRGRACYHRAGCHHQHGCPETEPPSPRAQPVVPTPCPALTSQPMTPCIECYGFARIIETRTITPSVMRSRCMGTASNLPDATSSPG